MAFMADGGESTEVAAHGGVHPVDALAADLQGASLCAGSGSAQQVCFGEVLDKFHLGGIVGTKGLLGVLHNVCAPLIHRSDAVDTA